MSKLGSLYIELGEPEGELSGGCCEVDDWAADEITRLRAEGSFIASRLEDRTNETGNLRDKLEIANIQITLLRAEVESLREDSERYRWLRMEWFKENDSWLMSHECAFLDYPEEMDAAIDAARKSIPTNNTKD